MPTITRTQVWSLNMISGDMRDLQTAFALAFGHESDYFCKRIDGQGYHVGRVAELAAESDPQRSTTPPQFHAYQAQSWLESLSHDQKHQLCFNSPKPRKGSHRLGLTGFQATLVYENGAPALVIKPAWA